MLIDIRPGAVFQLPSERHVRVVSVQGPTATCVYCTEAGEPDVRDLEATVSLNARFLRNFGKPAPGNVQPTAGMAQ